MNQPDSNSGQPAKPNLPWMNRLEQTLWAVLLAIFIVLSGVSFLYHRIRENRFIDIERDVPQLDYQLAIDLNSAEWSELTTLPGISETYARRIVEFRTHHGRFQAIEELTNVPGIGPKRLDQIRMFLYVDEATDSPEESINSELQADLR